MNLRLALAQMRCEKGHWEGNLAQVERLMSDARAADCDFIVFPEMGLSGYCHPEWYPEAVEPLDSTRVQRFVEMTGRYGIAASGGFIEANPDGKPFITQLLAQNGQAVGVYRKVNVVEEEAELFSPGSVTPAFTLPLPGGDLPCALAVCADSDRPDLFRAFAEKGARVVFHSSAPGLYGRRTDADSWREGYEWYRAYLAERLPDYARDNKLFITVATQTGATSDEDFPGGSFVFAPDGSCIASTDGPGEVLLLCDLGVNG